MKWIKKIVLINLMLLIRISIGLEQLPAEPEIDEKLELKEDILLEAVMCVESSYDSRAINHKENAVGILQIRPIMIREANRILALQRDDRRFTLNDRADSLKSVQVWYIVQGHHNPEYDPILAARIWNGRRMPEWYWVRVKSELNKLGKDKYYEKT